jgi:MoaA/NifB/PqqE/SkfB family radical SAM enzyme
MTDCGGLSPFFQGELTAWAREHQLPLNLTMELTPVCNFKCVMCYVRREPHGVRLLSAEQWLELAAQARELGALNLTITGGEPLLHPQFWEIYSKLNEMGFLITLLSNGSLMDEGVMEKFRQFGMPHCVKLTLYGTSDESYLRTCGCSDGFTRVKKAVELLQEAGVPLNLTSTIVRQNACDLQEIYRFARERGLPMQHTLSVVKSPRGVVNSVESSRFAFEEFIHELTIEDLERSKFPPLQSPFAWCLSKGCSLWVTWEGRLQICTFLTTPSVPWSGHLDSDWRTLLEAVDAVKSPVQCGDCQYSPFCQRCPGILCAESGHPEEISTDLCHTAQCLFEQYQLWRKA